MPLGTGRGRLSVGTSIAVIDTAAQARHPVQMEGMHIIRLSPHLPLLPCELVIIFRSRFGPLRMLLYICPDLY